MREQTRRAFTLLETVVVLVLLGILAGMVVGGFGAFSERSKDTTAQATIDRTLTAERAFANSFGSYTNHPNDLLDLDRDVDVVASPAQSTAGNMVSIAVGDKGTLGLAVESESGKCFLYTAAPIETGFLAPSEPGIDAAGEKSEAPAGAPCNGAEAIPTGEGVTVETPKR